MRVKHLWNYVPLPAKFKLLVDRITFSRLTLIYFLFAVVHCIIQVVFQVQAFNINMSAARFLGDIITQGNATEKGFMVLGDDLRLCNTVPVPATIDASSCQLVWSGASAKKNGSTIAGLAAQNAAGVSNGSSSSLTSSSVASSVPVSSSSILATSSSNTTSGTASSSSTLVSSSAALQSSAVSSGSVSAKASSASQKSTVTVTVRPTITNLSQFQTDIVRATQTVTVTTKATASVTDDDAEEDLAISHHKRTTVPTVRLATTSNGTEQVQIDGLPGIGSVTLSETCLMALNWPVSRVDNTKREDIVFVGFSIWVLGMSTVAILNESPPHIVASFLTHMLATAWSGYQLFNTNQFHADFSRLVTTGACGVNLLPTYWHQRQKFEVPTLAMNALALVVSAILSWRLLKQFGWQTFKRIGASLTVSRAYRIILIFSIVIQLSLFFIIVAVSLWIDQIYNGDIARLTTRSEIFRGIDITILIVVFPWLTMGWLSVRREYRLPMLAFLGLSFLYLAGWASMFAAPTFRWTFVEWQFFGIMASASVFLTVILLCLGVLCRSNFGKGLPKYLHPQEPLPGDDFEPANLPYEKFDEEKIDFPSYDTPIPTFSAAYGDDLVAPQPAHLPLGSRVLGPRFFNQSTSPVQLPTLSAIPPRTKGHLARQGSGSSQKSDMSAWSDSSEGGQSMRGKRWVIE